jgi:hypothetical protein
VLLAVRLAVLLLAVLLLAVLLADSGYSVEKLPDLQPVPPLRRGESSEPFQTELEQHVLSDYNQHQDHLCDFLVYV